MIEAIKLSFEKTFNEIINTHSVSELRHINEQVFRYLLIKNLPDDIEKEDEWKRIDLLLHKDDILIPIELKFYDRRPLKNFKNNSKFYKGGAGKQNFSEFIKSSEILVELNNNPIIKNTGVRFSNGLYIIVAIDRKSDKTKFSDYYKGKHLDELKKYNIKSKELIKLDAQKGDFNIFGWILDINKN